jgi:hypothetical protein
MRSRRVKSSAKLGNFQGLQLAEAAGVKTCDAAGKQRAIAKTATEQKRHFMGLVLLILKKY